MNQKKNQNNKPIPSGFASSLEGFCGSLVTYFGVWDYYKAMNKETLRG